MKKIINVRTAGNILLVAFGLLAVFHSSVYQVLTVLIFIMAGLLVVTTIFSWNVIRGKDQPEAAAPLESL